MSNKYIELAIEKAGNKELLAGMCWVTAVTVKNWQMKGEMSPFPALIVEDNFEIPAAKLAPQIKKWPSQCIPKVEKA